MAQRFGLWSRRSATSPSFNLKMSNYREICQDRQRLSFYAWWGFQVLKVLWTPLQVQSDKRCQSWQQHARFEYRFLKVNKASEDVWLKTYGDFVYKGNKNSDKWMQIFSSIIYFLQIAFLMQLKISQASKLIKNVKTKKGRIAKTKQIVQGVFLNTPKVSEKVNTLFSFHSISLNPFNVTFYICCTQLEFSSKV